MGAFFFILCFMVPLVLIFIFFFISKKEKKEFLLGSSFECGFSSYFYSRYSFSIHYFLVGLIFLFLDLELCVIMPFMMGCSFSFNSVNILLIFITLLLTSLILEWKEGKLEWSS